MSILCIRSFKNRRSSVTIFFVESYFFFVAFSLAYALFQLENVIGALAALIIIVEYHDEQQFYRFYYILFSLF